MYGHSDPSDVTSAEFHMYKGLSQALGKLRSTPGPPSPSSWNELMFSYFEFFFSPWTNTGIEINLKVRAHNLFYQNSDRE